MLSAARQLPICGTKFERKKKKQTRKKGFKVLEQKPTNSILFLNGSSQPDFNELEG